MKALFTAVIAAIEAVAVAVAGFAVIAVPSVLVWWIAFDLEADLPSLFSVVVAIWQLVHLIPMTVDIPAVTALGMGLPAEDIHFTISLAPLGLTAVTVALAARSGWRLSQRGEIGWAIVGGAAGFAVAACSVALTARDAAWPVWLTVVVPTLVYAIPLAIGAVSRAALAGQDWWRRGVRAIQRLWEPVNGPAAAALPERAAETLRLALVALASLVSLGALGFTVLLCVKYVDVIALSQSLHLDVLGALMVCILQLALLPIAWIWAIAWFAGPGFAIGIGSSLTPFDTLVWPLPSLPLLGALPNDWGWAGALAPVLIVVLGAIIGGVAAGQAILRRSSVIATLTIPVAASALAGLVIALLGWLASGSIGPGRLEVAGVQAWVIGGAIAIELAVGMLIGIGARQVDVARMKTAVLTRVVPAASSEARDDLPADQYHVVPYQASGPHSSQDSEPAVPHEHEHEDDADTRPIAPLEPFDSVNQPDPVDPLLQAYSWETPADATPDVEDSPAEQRGLARWRRTTRESE